MAAWDGARDDPRFRKLVADIVQIAGPPRLRTSGTRPAADRAGARQGVDAGKSAAVARPAGVRCRTTPRQEPASGPASDVPAPRSASGLRTVVVGIGSLVAVGLVGGFVLFGTAREPSPGPEPRVPVAEQEPDLPAARPGPSAPEPERTQRQRDPAPLSTFRDTLQDGSSGPEMVVLPADQFKMGCVSGKDCLDRELPVRTVTFEEPFAIGKHEVTFAEYDRYAAATNVEKPGDQGWGRGPRPVINVAWSDAAAYCDWLGEQTGRRYRLPSEAQWEYAARAGTATPWSFGDDAAVLGDYGWYFGNADGQTHPVGKKRPNPWGLYDMHGNVWEWVQDSWHGSYEGAPDDGTAWESGGSGAARVIRGGSWGVYAQGCRSAVRGDGQPGGRYYYLGFRCARAQE